MGTEPTIWTRIAAGWISEPGPLPRLVGEPVMALVLRREERDDE